MDTKDQICRKFLDNPQINPETGKGLKKGYKPFYNYIDLCRSLGYNDEVDELLGLKQESTTKSTSTTSDISPKLSLKPVIKSSTMNNSTTSIISPKLSVKPVTKSTAKPVYESTITNASTSSVVSPKLTVKPVTISNDLLKEQSERNLDDPFQIKVGDVGTYTKGGKYGREYWDGFVVTKIITAGKKVEVEFDYPILIGKEKMTQIKNPDGYGWILLPVPESNKIRILEYRRPGKWMFKGVPAKDIRGEIEFGEKRSGAEEGWF